MKNIFKDKRGFTLLEILVTVGIVGVLSAVAVPAYNQYKKGTIETAVESDVGNFQKAYMAYNAVNGTYCADFKSAGIQVRDNRNYKQGGAIGFETINPACGGTPADKKDVQVIPESGTCNGDSAATTSQGTTCQGHDTQTVCDAGTNCEWKGNTKGSIATECELSIDQLVMGATTAVSGINKAWAINEEGKIVEGATTDTEVNCPGFAGFEGVFTDPSTHTF